MVQRELTIKLNFFRCMCVGCVFFFFQAQLREVTLQEENAAYEKAISSCEGKIQEKMQEAELLLRKLEVSTKVRNIFILASF